ncbi:MAG: HPr(Ser) kinase/phosphatase, partial [Lachnospiraceae bacterium]|nr:HPr(Ser) kinase/phosphatase [Candidatus Minthocola equi]
MSGITVGKMARDLRLCELTPEIDADLIEITVDDINRPALQLAGFYEFFNAKRVQIIGNVEYA